MDSNKGLVPEKREMDPEDELLFQELDEDTTESKSTVPGSWLRYMEYGDVSVLTKASARTSSYAAPPPTEEHSLLSDTTRTERIERSFVHTLPVHKNKSKNVVAEAVWEVLPDETCSCFDYGLVVR